MNTQTKQQTDKRTRHKSAKMGVWQKEDKNKEIWLKPIEQMSRGVIEEDDGVVGDSYNVKREKKQVSREKGEFNNGGK